MPEVIDSLFIHALTGLHPGSGTALGVVDLPVQRERHTSWPVIPASSLKGVMRAATRPANGDGRDAWMAVFGPEKLDEADDKQAFAGALALTDARILAFPVRSLRGVFAWVTCPAVLERFKRDIALMTRPPAVPVPVTVPESLKPGTVLCAEDSPLLIDQTGRMILEEFDFERQQSPPDLAGWIDALASAVEPDTRDRFKKNLAILHNDDFGHFVQHATEVVARVGLDAKTKTVRDGALFYEEVLPPETLFHALVMADASRKAGHARTAGEVLAWLKTDCRSRLTLIQIGADETIGRGFCRLTWQGEGA